MVRFSVPLASCYAHVFVLLWVVIVTLPSGDGDSKRWARPPKWSTMCRMRR